MLCLFMLLFENVKHNPPKSENKALKIMAFYWMVFQNTNEKVFQWFGKIFRGVCTKPVIRLISLWIYLLLAQNLDAFKISKSSVDFNDKERTKFKVQLFFREIQEYFEYDGGQL